MEEFDSIRPYNDQEVQGAVQRLLVDKMFMGVVNTLYPDQEMATRVLFAMKQAKTVEDFQSTIVYTLLDTLIKSSTDGLTYSAMDQFQSDENYLFISNHRDIILDSAFLNYLMLKHGFKMTEIAIGDNLLIFDWIKDLVRINRSFIVKRNLGIREQLAESKTLSKYIRHTIENNGNSVWIAQREGRTKDGNDSTQPALLKMLNMGGGNDLKENIRKLNIVPMAISYEIEPCGISKVEELLKRKHNPDFTKSQQDDLQSMANGFISPKGRVQFAFGNPVNLKLDKISEGKNKNEIIQAVTNYIDRRIYYNFKLWPNNYIAIDLLSDSTKHSDNYTEDQKEEFISRMNKDVSKIDFSENEVKEYYLKMYANPVINYQNNFG